MLSGRYGPYVKHGDVNATLPRGKEPAALTMDEAVQLIAERAAKGPSKPKGAARQEPPTQGRRRAAAEGKAKPPSRKAPRPRPRPSRRHAERRRSRLRTLDDGAPQTERSPPRAGLPSKEDILDYRARRRRQGRQARDRARLLGSRAATASPSRSCSPRWPTRACSPATARASRSAASLPPVAVLEIVARDEDGELIAEPAVWDAAEGERPRALVLAPRGEAPARRAGARPGRPHPGAHHAARGAATSPATATRPSRSSGCRASSGACSASSAPRPRAAASSIPSTARSCREWPVAAGDEGDAKRRRPRPLRAGARAAATACRRRASSRRSATRRTSARSA